MRACAGGGGGHHPAPIALREEVEDLFLGQGGWGTESPNLNLKPYKFLCYPPLILESYSLNEYLSFFVLH